MLKPSTFQHIFKRPTSCVRLVIFCAIFLAAVNAFYYTLLTGSVVLSMSILAGSMLLSLLIDLPLYITDRQTPIMLYLFDEDFVEDRSGWAGLLLTPGIIAGMLSPEFVLWDAVDYLRGML